MNKIHKRRFYAIAIIGMGLSIAAFLILYALKQNINLFLTPSQIPLSLSKDYHFRLGGLVKQGSFMRDKNSLACEFDVTDLKKTIHVKYVGILPDLFHEGKGIVAEGSLNQSNTFIATTVLAKHDENYMPKNVYKSMRSNLTS